MAEKKGYIGVDIVTGGFIVEVITGSSYEGGKRQVLTSKAKVIKLIREALDSFEEAPEADAE